MIMLAFAIVTAVLGVLTTVAALLAIGTGSSALLWVSIVFGAGALITGATTAVAVRRERPRK